jgi:hypothetical protein
MLGGVLRKNDFREHSISKRCQGLRGYLILIYETAVYHFRLRLLN